MCLLVFHFSACFEQPSAHHQENKLYQYISFSLQRFYCPGRASASFKGFLHPSRFRATIFQFLHPSLATSSSTPSSQRSLGLPVGRFPPGSLRRTLLDKSSSSWLMTCPAHLSLLSLLNFTMSFSVSIHHLVYITVCRWPSGMQVREKL